MAEDADAYAEGSSANRKRVQNEIEEITSRHTRTGNISELDLTPSDGTLHEAMKSYMAWIKQDWDSTTTATNSCAKCGREVRSLRCGHCGSRLPPQQAQELAAVHRKMARPGGVSFLFTQDEYFTPDNAVAMLLPADSLVGVDRFPTPSVDS